MNIKAILAVLAGAVVSYLLGWVVFGILLKDFFWIHTTHYPGLAKVPAQTWAHFLSSLAWATLITYVLVNKASEKSIMMGVVTGAILAFLITASYDLNFYAAWNLYGKRLLLTDVAVNTAMNAITGGVMGWILGMDKQP